MSPGPGSFIPTSTLSKVAFTMRVRPKENLLDKTKNYPGPGSYDNLPALNPLGKYSNSRIPKYFLSANLALKPLYSVRLKGDSQLSNKIETQ